MLGKAVALNIVEIRSPDLNAQLVAENIAAQLEKRISFRRAMKQAMQQRDPSGRQGHQGAPAAAVWAALKSPEARPTTKAPSRCRLCVRTSITASRRPPRPMAASAVKVWIYKGEVLNSTLRQQRTGSAGRSATS